MAKSARQAATFADLAQFLAMRREGLGRMLIAEKLGRSSATIQNWMEAARDGRTKAVEGGIKHAGKMYASDGGDSLPQHSNTDNDIREAADAMRVEAEKRGKKKRKTEKDDSDLRGPANPRVVSPERPERPKTDVLWAAHEKSSNANIQYVKGQSLAEINLGEGPVALTFVSDQHIEGDGLTDLKRMREDATLIRDTKGVYALLGGDGVNNHIKHRGAIIHARSTPDDAWALYDHYLGLLDPKIIAVTSGNHDLWSSDFAGIDMVKRLADSHRLFYAPHQVYMTVIVGQQKYVLGLRHQYRYGSSFNMGHSIHRWYDMGERTFDIGVICHHHESWVGTFKRHGKNIWGARPGSYQVTSGYAGQYGFNDSDPTCPTFILYGDDRRVAGFDDLRTALAVLRSRR